MMTAIPALCRARAAVWLRRGACIVVLAVPCASPVLAQDPGLPSSAADVVRGQVTDSSGAPIAGAGVVITGLQTLQKRTAHTDARGRYQVLFGDAEGEYIVTVRAIGYTPQGVRIRRAPESNSPFLVANLVLSRTVVMLDTVAVNGRPRDAGDVGAGSASSDVTRGALFSLDPSDLAALAARAPGVARLGQWYGDRRFSVLGGSPDQNRITVDGSTVVSPQLPPDAIAKATLSQTTYDASQGNFAGGQLTIITRGGSDYLEEHLHLDYADPRLAWEDPAAPTNLARNTNWSGGLSGPIQRGHAYFNVAASRTTTESPALSLLSLRPAQRVQYGLSVDSIAAVQGALTSLGLPPRPPEIPDATTGTVQSLFTRFDVQPTGGSSLQLAVNGDEQRHLGSGVGPLSFPSLAAGSGARGGRVQLSGSTVVHGLLHNFVVAGEARSQWSHPLLGVPHGVVRVGTEFAGGQTGITQVDFGGSASGRDDSRVRTLALSDGLLWTSPTGRHRLSLGGSLELNRSYSNSVRDPFGTYSYQSWSDLAANKPAAYTRTIAASALDSRTTTGAIWLGGNTTARKGALSLEYGLRLDVARANTLPPFNPSVDSALGVRTDRVPKAVGATPRFGFNWRLKNPGPTAPPVVLTGGVGGFRGVIPPSRVAGLTNQTGLPDATRQLACAGDATPIPDWQSYAASTGSAPSQCLDGSAATTFGSTSPAIAAFDPSYQPPTAWRGNLGLANLLVHGWALGVSGVYSVTVHNESSVDLNLRRTAAFTLSSERDRPVYVAPDAIVPGTGAIAQAASRSDDRFASVTSFRSDLGAVAAQLLVSASPARPIFSGFNVGFQYGFNYGRTQRRAFDGEGSTGGDPFAREWAAMSQPAHELHINGSLDLRHFSYASLKFETLVSSGRLYTPMVGGDVNGDGRFDDRAFIFDPSATGDSSLARQMSSLLATSTRSTRRCLLRQAGRIAGMNSCSTGWRVQPAVGLDLNLPWQNFGTGALDNHLHVGIATSNAIGALVRLFHLEQSALGSLTAANYPTDPVLAYVTGFDPNTRTFRYQVNQQFGEGRSQRVRSSRYAGAFQVSFGGDLHFGGAPTLPLVEQLGLVPSDRKAPLYTREELRRKLAAQAVSPYAIVLRFRDTLLLNDAQIAELTRLDSAFQLRADSALAPVADYVAANGRKSSDQQVQKRMERATEPMVKMLVDRAPEEIGSILTEQQIDKLPEFLAPLVRERRRKPKP